MTDRETKIAKRILDALHELDGGQAHALTIHGEIGGLGLCSSVEFESVLAELDKRKLVMFIETKFKGRMWNITDAGEAARLQMT